jgi:hypothetical protein
MPTPLDGPLRGVTQQVLSLLGGSATLRRIVRVYDPLTDLDQETVTTFALKVSPPEPYSVGRIDGTLIRQGDARCLVAGADLDAIGIVFPPGSYTSLYLEIGSTRWTIVSGNELRSGDQTAAVELQLRR